MRIGWTLLLSLLLLQGCDVRPSEAAPTGALTSVHIPVGPIPGNDNPPNLPANPFAEDPIALTEGRRLFVDMNCAGCHGDHGGGGMGPSLRDEAWMYGGQDARVFASIAEGRSNGMPAWGAKLPENQVWQLAGYVKSLRTPQEPEPPQ